MSFIAKKRKDKRTEPTPRLRDEDLEDEEFPIPERAASLNTSSEGTPKRKLIALRRNPKVTTDLSAAKICGGGDVRGDYRGEIKEGMGTIKRGEQGGSEEGEPELPQVLASLVRKAHIAFKRKQTRQSNKPVPLPKLDKVWFNTMTATFPRSVPPLWDAKHRSLAKHLATRLGREEVIPFIRWAIENWTAVIHTSFAWMTKQAPPALPALPFLVQFVHVFKEAKEKANDAPLEVATLVKGLNLAKKPALRRAPNTPPVSTPKPVLPKKDLSATVNPLPSLPDWRD